MVFERPDFTDPERAAYTTESLFTRLASETAFSLTPPAAATDALGFTAVGATTGASLWTAGSWLGHRTAEAVIQGGLNAFKPIIGEVAGPFTPLSAIAKAVTWRGAAIGAAAGLLSYGVYEGYKYLTGSSEA